MKKILLGLVAVIGLIIGLQSCNEEIELIGEFRETAIVYGLLDQADSIHMIKITRAFIGDGDTDANIIAANPDSSYFASVTGTVTEMVNDVPTGRVFTLTDTLVNNKDENGVFYAPQQKLYVFYTDSATPLLGNATYRLDVDINNGAFELSGTTPMVDGISDNISGSAQPFKFVDNMGLYKPTSVVTNAGTSHQIHTKLTVEFTEWVGLSPTVKSFDWSLGEVETNPGESKTFIANGELFYDLVKKACTNDPLIDKRTFTSMTVVITGGAEDFVNYILVNEPSSTLAQSKPTFTNLTATNGHPVVGIFSSRQTISTKRLFNDPFSSFWRVIDKKSTERLCTGAITGSYFFCSDHTADLTEPWACI